MKTEFSDMDGEALNTAVAIALGWQPDCHGDWIDEDGNFQHSKCFWNPSDRWDQGGPIIEEFGIMMDQGYGIWFAGKSRFEDTPAAEYEGTQKSADESGRTPLIAGMRAFLAWNKWLKEEQDADQP